MQAAQCSRAGGLASANSASGSRRLSHIAARCQAGDSQQTQQQTQQQQQQQAASRRGVLGMGASLLAVVAQQQPHLAAQAEELVMGGEAAPAVQVRGRLPGFARRRYHRRLPPPATQVHARMLHQRLPCPIWALSCTKHGAISAASQHFHALHGG